MFNSKNAFFGIFYRYFFNKVIEKGNYFRKSSLYKINKYFKKVDQNLKMLSLKNLFNKNRGFRKYIIKLNI